MVFKVLSVSLVLDSVGSISHSDTIAKLGSKSLFLLVLDAVAFAAHKALLSIDISKVHWQKRTRHVESQRRERETLLYTKIQETKNCLVSDSGK